MKRTSARWFRSQSQSHNAVNFAKSAVVSRTNASTENTTNTRQEDEDGNRFFVVGESIVGGDDII